MTYASAGPQSAAIETAAKTTLALPETAPEFSLGVSPMELSRADAIKWFRGALVRYKDGITEAEGTGRRDPVWLGRRLLDKVLETVRVTASAVAVGEAEGHESPPAGRRRTNRTDLVAKFRERRAGMKSQVRMWGTPTMVVRRLGLCCWRSERRHEAMTEVNETVKQEANFERQLNAADRKQVLS